MVVKKRFLLVLLVVCSVFLNATDRRQLGNIHSVALLVLQTDMSKLELAALQQKAEMALRKETKLQVINVYEDQVLKSPELLPDCDVVLVLKRDREDATNYATKQTYTYRVVSLVALDGKRFKIDPAATLGEEPIWVSKSWSGEVDPLIHSFSKAVEKQTRKH